MKQIFCVLVGVALLTVVSVVPAHESCVHTTIDGDWEVFRTDTTYPIYHLVAQDLVKIWYQGLETDTFEIELQGSKWTYQPMSQSHSCDGDRIVLSMEIRNRGCIHELKIWRALEGQQVPRPDGTVSENQIDIEYVSHKGSCPTAPHVGGHDEMDPGHSHADK